jgi:hypothetical protein
MSKVKLRIVITGVISIVVVILVFSLFSSETENWALPESSATIWELSISRSLKD